ncbi:LAMI_0B03136g1_1 [Lachancea mirantina]|uniref:LAMI_0B03136g1_1 n=1 Tax=Lachancea mirantina TaxID=1230905 RepID=A0A1G4IUS1_9SACH|nr:LAMI_0B03136g1_1 [Lachancea mirantina]
MLNGSSEDTTEDSNLSCNGSIDVDSERNSPRKKWESMFRESFDPSRNPFVSIVNVYLEDTQPIEVGYEYDRKPILERLPSATNSHLASSKIAEEPATPPQTPTLRSWSGELGKQPLGSTDVCSFSTPLVHGGYQFSENASANLYRLSSQLSGSVESVNTDVLFSRHLASMLHLSEDNHSITTGRHRKNQKSEVESIYDTTIPRAERATFYTIRKENQIQVPASLATASQAHHKTVVFRGPSEPSLKHELVGDKVLSDAINEKPDETFHAPPSALESVPNEEASNNSAASRKVKVNLPKPRIPYGSSRPSLLTNILVPPPRMPAKKRLRKITSIPALRKVSGSSRVSSSSSSSEVDVEPKPPVGDPNVDAAGDTFRKGHKIPPIPTNQHPHRTSANSMLQIYQFRDVREKYDVEACIHSQHIDAASISSDASTKTALFELFSPMKILITLCICTIIPPLYFLIGLGSRGFISDERLLNFLLRDYYTHNLFAGFAWDINVSWFRLMCLILGSLETFIIFACIAVGFAVGKVRER